jgi:hypothetical protein
MSTQAYYKDRLGFDPAEALNDGSAFDKTQHGYEENLCKFKGLWEFYIESIGMGPHISKPAVSWCDCMPSAASECGTCTNSF